MEQHGQTNWEDLEIEYKIGEGAFSVVFLASINSQEYALKEMNKYKLKRQHAEHLPLVERQILKSVSHPGIVNCKCFFHTSSKFGSVLEYLPTRLQDLVVGKRMTEEGRRFYFGQLVNTVEYLHSNGIIHRDLKPSNLLLSSSNHLKVIDFGTACVEHSRLVSQGFKMKLKQLKGKEEKVEFNLEQNILGTTLLKKRRSSFVGTSFYVAPQLLEKDICEEPADLWALGCLLYFFYYCHSPFADSCQYKIYQRIKSGQFEFPENRDLTAEAKDLISKLLVKNPLERLGSGFRSDLSFAALKKHPYFHGIDIDRLYQKQPPGFEALGMELQLKLKKKEAELLLMGKGERDDVEFDQILIRNTQEKDMVSRLVVLKDKTVEVYDMPDGESDSVIASKLVVGKGGRLGWVVGPNRLKLRTVSQYFFFSCLNPKRIVDIINSLLSSEEVLPQNMVGQAL